MDSPESRLEQLGIALPDAPAAVAAYQPVRCVGSMAFVSGQIPIRDGSLQAVGRVGEGVSPEKAVEAARLCGINALAALRGALGGSLDRVAGIIRVGVFVAAPSDFQGHPAVADGASRLFLEVFGDAGRHARAAVGAPSLPLGVPVEVEVLAEIHPSD